MNPFKIFRRRKNNVQSLANVDELIGWHATGINTLEYYRDNQYENGYGSISKIVNTFMDIKPYTVNEKGDRVESNLQTRLYHPNRDMSSSDFREALAVMSLIHDRVFILCWRNEAGEAKPGGVITAQNLAGFTFLENPIVTIINGKKLYTYKGSSYTEDEVIELKDINPYNLHKGFSPAKAASKWASIDDYIAAYQTGFFKNGAIPAGQFIITASTPQEFNDEVDKLEAKHKGAGKNNNIVYVHRPMDREGKPSSAKIEWIPFNVQNKDLSLEALFEQVNKKIDSTYGVPAEIRGILSNSNYASVTVAERIFIKYVVKPFTQKVYTRFTHQLNRITGGMGIAISFELEVPGLADEEKVEEETKKIRDERVQFYLERGYTLTSIKNYLETDDITALELTAPVKEEANDDVDMGDEVDGAPDVPDGAGDGTELYAKFAKVRPIVRAESANPDVDQQLIPYEQQISDLLNTQINKQAARMASTVQDAVEEATEEENDDLTNAILAILMSLMIMRGNAVYNESLRNALNQGFDVTGTTKYSAPMPEEMEKQLKEFVKGFNDDTANEISTTVASAVAAGVSAVAIRAMLQNFASTQGYRVNRFAQNEAWTANQTAKLGALEQITDELNQKQTIVGFKTWLIQPGACPICTPYNGEKVEIASFFSNGLKMPPLHVQCRCDMQESWEKQTVQDVVEKNLHCKDCDRFLGTTTQDTYTDKIKCANSKCKALEIPIIKESE